MAAALSGLKKSARFMKEKSECVVMISTRWKQGCPAGLPIIFQADGNKKPGGFGTAYLFLKTIWSSFTSTTILSSLFSFPESIIFESSFSTSFCTTRFSGRAPNWGS